MELLDSNANNIKDATVKSLLSTLPSSSPFSILASFSPNHLAQHALLQDLLHISCSTSSSSSSEQQQQTPNTIPATEPAVTLPDPTTTTKGTGTVNAATLIPTSPLILTEKPRALLLYYLMASLDPGSPVDRLRMPTVEKCLDFMYAMADLCMLHMPVTTLGRSCPTATGLAMLKAAVDEVARLKNAGVVSFGAASRKKLLMIVVHGCDEDEPEMGGGSSSPMKEQLIRVVLKEMEQVFAPTPVTDLFDFDFTLLPTKSLQPAKYKKAVNAFRDKLMNPAADDYLLLAKSPSATENGPPPYASQLTPDEILPLSKKILNAMSAKPTGLGSSSGDPSSSFSSSSTSTSRAAAAATVLQEKDMPSEDQLHLAFAIDQVYTEAWAAYQTKIRKYRQEVEDMQVVRNFGEDATKMVDECRAHFAGACTALISEAAAPKNDPKSPLYLVEKKMELLTDAILLDLQSLHTKLLAKLSDLAFDLFSSKLETVAFDAKVERNYQTIVQEGDQYFKEKAALLCPKNQNWRFDHERSQFVTNMREAATERLQYAKLEGRYQAPERDPVALSFHYLHPDPFHAMKVKDTIDADDNLGFNPSKQKTFVDLDPRNIMNRDN